jgi:hypothetical protein
MILRGYGQLHDDFIDEQYAHRNYGINNVLEFGVKYTAGALYKRKTLIRPEMSLWRNHAELIDSVRLVIFSSGGQGHASSYFYISRLLANPTYGDTASTYCPTDSAGMVYNARHCLCDSATGDVCSVDSLSWAELGCNGIGSDFVATPSDSFQLTTVSGDSVMIDLTEDFRWFHEHRDSVFGWVLWRNESTPFGTYRGIISSNATFSGGIYRPRLEIFYSPKRAALVLNDTSSAAAIGVDSLLYLAMRDDLDYEVDYLTDADVVSYGSTYFDTRQMLTRLLRRALAGCRSIAGIMMKTTSESAKCCCRMIATLWSTAATGSPKYCKIRCSCFSTVPRLPPIADLHLTRRRA